MKIVALLALSVFALTGCDDTQLARTAQGSVDHMAYASGGHGGWKFEDLQRSMRRRQQQWDYYNRYQWGHRPGWAGRPCKPETVADPCRALQSGRQLAVMLPSQMNAPALGLGERKAYAQVGREHGIGMRSSVILLESLNRAAVGDFGGLAGLGLNRNGLEAARRNNGRLAAAELDRLSRRLGVSERKLDSVIQSVFGKR